MDRKTKISLGISAALVVGFVAVKIHNMPAKKDGPTDFQVVAIYCGMAVSEKEKCEDFFYSVFEQWRKNDNDEAVNREFKELNRLVCEMPKSDKNKCAAFGSLLLQYNEKHYPKKDCKPLLDLDPDPNDKRPNCINSDE